MSTTGSNGALICLRCQLQALRSRQTARRTRPSPRALFSSTAAQHDESAAPPKLQPVATQTSEPIIRPGNGRLGTLSEHPLGEYQRTKKGARRAGSAKLAIKTLGKESEVIILRELGFTKAQAISIAPLTSNDSESLKQLTKEEILASISKEGLKTLQEDVNKQLDALRPKPPDEGAASVYIGQKEFEQLHQTIVKGFLLAQLQKYVFRKTKRARKPATGQATPTVEPLAQDTRLTPWRPGRTPPHVPLAKIKTGRDAGKERLVSHLMRNIWNLVVTEDAESVGEMEISLEKVQLHLLQSDTDINLDSISRQRGVEIHLTKRLLRITADKERAEYAADDILRSIKSIVSQRVSLHAIMAKPRQSITEKTMVSPQFSGLEVEHQKFRDLGLEDIRKAAQKSGTMIEPILHETEKWSPWEIRQVTVHGLSQQACDDARSIMFGLMMTQRQDKNVVQKYEVVGSDQEKIELQTPVLDHMAERNGPNRGFRRLMHSCERSTDPSEGLASSGPLSLPASPKAKNKSLRDAKIWEQLSMAKQESLWPTAVNKSDQWSGVIDTERTAAFGHVLLDRAGRVREKWHQQQTPEPTNAKPTLSAFTPTLEGLPQVLEHLSRTQPPSTLTRTSKTLILDLIPSSINGPIAPQIYPNLEMRWSINESTHTATLISLRAKVLRRISDNLLPSKTADVRFQAQQFVTANPTVNIRTFSEHVESLFAAGQKLRALPQLVISMPSLLPDTPPDLTKGGKSSKKRAKAKAKKAVDVLKDIAYHPTVFRLEQSATMPLGPFELVYESTDGGSVFGVQNQLSIRVPNVKLGEAHAETVGSGQIAVADEQTTEASTEATPNEPAMDAGEIEFGTAANEADSEVNASSLSSKPPPTDSSTTTPTTHSTEPLPYTRALHNHFVNTAFALASYIDRSARGEDVGSFEVPSSPQDSAVASSKSSAAGQIDEVSDELDEDAMSAKTKQKAKAKAEIESEGEAEIEDENDVESAVQDDGDIDELNVDPREAKAKAQAVIEGQGEGKDDETSEEGKEEWRTASKEEMRAYLEEWKRTVPVKPW